VAFTLNNSAIMLGVLPTKKSTVSDLRRKNNP